MMSVVQNPVLVETITEKIAVSDHQLVESVNNTVAIDPLTERVRMLELALNYVSQQQFPQPEQSYGMLVALALKGKDKVTLKALCPTCGKTYAYQGLCRDYFHQPAPVRDVI